MKERPILFSTPMVQAILAGKKTMTRRVVTPNCLPGAPMSGFEAYQIDDGPNQGKFGFSSEDADWVCPYGRPGDLLWVRETWRFKELETGEDFVEYAAGGEMTFPNDPNLTWSGNPFDGKWRPSIHMSKWASRLWLKVKSVRVERLREITEAGAIAEGIWETDDMFHIRHGWGVAKEDGGTAVGAFRILWDSLNGKPRANGQDISWAANPWVWVPEFERTDRPQAAREE